MSIYKEFKEFFLRNTSVSVGTKPDQEVGFPTQNYVGSDLKYNRFLQGNYPTKKVFEKFLESITFKLNKEDRAQASQQGLAVIASDTNAESRTSNATNGSAFTAFTTPHQLPEIVLATDGNDAVVGTPVEVGGLKLSILRRTLSGLFRKNYKLEVNVDKSVVIDGTTKKVQLKNDVDTPGNDYRYGTSYNGTKGFIKEDNVKKFYFKTGSISAGDSFTLTGGIIAIASTNNTNILSGYGTGTADKAGIICQLWYLNSGVWQQETIGLKNDVGADLGTQIKITESSGDITVSNVNNAGVYKLVIMS